MNWSARIYREERYVKLLPAGPLGLQTPGAEPRLTTNDTVAFISAPALRVHATLRYVVIDGQETPLQPRELALLDLLSRGGAPCLGTSALSQALLGGSSARERRLLAQHLHSLRRKLGRFGAHIEFTRAEGYRTWLRLQWLHITPPSGDAEPQSELRGRCAAG
jgi:DNA-binding response OmpR family regulator